MVRVLDAATQGAVRNPALIIPRNFVLVIVKDNAGALVPFGFTDFGEDVSVSVIDGETLLPTVRTFYGDNTPILKIDPIPLKIGLEVDTTQISLSQIHPVVEQMARGHNCRNARVEIYRGYLDPESMLLVAPPRPRRLGQINGMPINTPAAGGEGSIVLRVVSHTRELTRINHAMRSDETQRLRDGDRFRRYAGVVNWDFWWGEVKGGQAETTQGSGVKGGRG